MYLQQEINEQPDVIARLLNEQHAATQTVADAIRDFNPAFVSIAARGTSDNAARYAKYLFGHFTGLAVSLAAPSLHTIYGTPPNLSRALVIGISQSGQAEDVRLVLENARNQGALTMAITNFPDSPMAQTAEHHLSLLAGEEKSIAATKTYTAQLTVIAMLADALTPKSDMSADLARLPDYARQTLARNDAIAEWAERYRYMTQFVVLGRGFNYATAFEIALKVKELAYISSEGYSEADFRHGPIAMVQRGIPIMVIASQGKMLPPVVDLVGKLNEREAECLIISNDADALQQGRKAMPLPEMPEWLSPVVSIIPGQIFAMHQALVRDYAVDNPRGLSKVTVTK